MNNRQFIVCIALEHFANFYAYILTADIIV